MNMSLKHSDILLNKLAIILLFLHIYTKEMVFLGMEHFNYSKHLNLEEEKVSYSIGNLIYGI